MTEMSEEDLSAPEEEEDLGPNIGVSSKMDEFLSSASSFLKRNKFLVE